jgi:hypothetical protein
MLTPIPAGIVPDKSADFAYFALLSNGNSYCGQLETIVSAGTNSTLTAAQAIRRVVRLTTGASGGFTITLPSTKAIISALGPTIPTDGSYGQPFSILNDGIGQTGTLTAGDASTTITGTATALTDTRRDFFLTVTSPTTITYQNLGSAAI